IAKAIVMICVQEGAVVVLHDVNAERLASADQEFIEQFGKDSVSTARLVVTNQEHIEEAFKKAALAFGGVNIIVNNAGLSISKSIEDHTQKDWDLLYDVLVKGQFLVTQGATNVLK